MTMAVNEREIPEMRVISKYPAIQWEIIWKYIHHTALPEPIKSNWYAVVHEIIPTNEHSLTYIKRTLIDVRDAMN
jgi:hypothetical protein